MAYDELLAERIRRIVPAGAELRERKMFGGLAFMLHGNMCCGIVGRDLMVRIGPQEYEQALRRPHVRPMDFTGKPSRGMVYVDPAAVEREEDLASWVRLGVRFAESLPRK